MSAQPVDVLAVISRLVASVNDDEIELDARADLYRDGESARAAVAELIEAAKNAEAFPRWRVTSKENRCYPTQRECNVRANWINDKLRAAIAAVSAQP